jgi:hypothetical protein
VMSHTLLKLVRVIRSPSVPVLSNIFHSRPNLSSIVTCRFDSGVSSRIEFATGPDSSADQKDWQVQRVSAASLIPQPYLIIT